MKDQWLVRVVVVALGLVLGGWAAGNGVARSRLGDRYVTVKGISEREVNADLAIWPLRLVVAENDLARAQSRLQANVAEIYSFLARNQVDTAQVTLQDFSVVDALANEYRPAGLTGNRYIIRQVVMVRSDAP